MTMQAVAWCSLFPCQYVHFPSASHTMLTLCMVSPRIGFVEDTHFEFLCYWLNQMHLKFLLVDVKCLNFAQYLEANVQHFLFVAYTYDGWPLLNLRLLFLLELWYTKQ